MPVALVVVGVDVTRRKKKITYKPTFSGAYPAGGDTLDLTAATDPSFLSARIPSVAPEVLEIEGAPGGNGAEWVPGTTPANQKVKLWASQHSEHAAAGYNAAVSGDANVRIVATFPIGKA
jgi:hypothetical protein